MMQNLTAVCIWYIDAKDINENIPFVIVLWQFLQIILLIFAVFFFSCTKMFPNL